MTIPAPATALPWDFDPTGHFGERKWLRNTDGDFVVFPVSEQGDYGLSSREYIEICDQDAAYLKRACNSFPALVAALQEAADILEGYLKFLHEMPSSELEMHPYIPSVEEAHERARAALSLALGEQ